jgi:hypothetical protein
MTKEKQINIQGDKLTILKHGSQARGIWYNTYFQRWYCMDESGAIAELPKFEVVEVD